MRKRIPAEKVTERAGKGTPAARTEQAGKGTPAAKTERAAERTPAVVKRKQPAERIRAQRKKMRKVQSRNRERGLTRRPPVARCRGKHFGTE